MVPPLLSVENLSKSFGASQVLRDVSFEVGAGEIVGVWGRNASAKTTLACVLSGEQQPDGGALRLRGEPVGTLSVGAAHELGIAAVFGEVELVESLSVAENLLMGNMRRLGFGPGRSLVRRRRINDAAREVCAKYDLRIDVEDSVRTLSLPERQQVNLLKAVLRDPSVLIVDDAFSALSGEVLRYSFSILGELAARGAGILYLSHNHKQLGAVCGAVMKLEDGTLSPRQSPKAFADSLPTTEKSARLIPKLRTAKEQVLFSCRNLCYRQIIKNVSFDLHGGEVLGILGASNSGRTTMARVLYGDLPSSVGKIFLEGEPVDIDNPGAALNHHMALMLDDSNRFSLISNADLTSNITLNRYSRRIIRTNFVVSRQRERLEAEKIADRLGIRRDDMDQKAGELSASSQKLLILGRWLSAKCNVFLLDEPTQRLDAPGKLHIYNVINELSRQGKGVVFFLSDINEALGICDRILTLLDGQINGEFVAAHADFDELYEKIFR